MEFLLHIGSPKTGTSSIQHHLHLLQSASINYIAAYKESNLFFRFLRPQIHSKLSHKLRDSLYEKTRKLIEYKADPRALNILSAEVLSICNPTSVARLFRGHQVTCVLYVRNELDAMAANYSTVVKRELDPPSFSDFIESRIGRSNKDVIDPWFNEFGNKFSLEIFDKKRLADGDVVLDFFSKYIPEERNLVRNGEFAQINRSLTDKVIWLKKELYQSHGNLLISKSDLEVLEELSGRFGAPLRIPETYRENFEVPLAGACRQYSPAHFGEEQIFDYSKYPYSKHGDAVKLTDSEKLLITNEYFRLRSSETYRAR